MKISSMTALAFMAVSAIQVTAGAQPIWPNKPVRLVVAYPAGGGIDVIARGLAQQLSEKWGKPVTVDNKPGANTLIATEAVAHSTDNHTILVTTDATFTINPSLYEKLPYDLDRDFRPVTMVASFSQMLVASPSFPANNIKELIALAKKEPGALSYASYGSGSQPHLAMEMLKNKAGIDMVHVPYRGVPLALNAILANEVALTWSGLASAKQQILANKMKAIAYAGKSRSAEFPEVQTTSEAGFPDVEANVWVGLFAPVSVAPETVSRIDKDIREIVSNPVFMQKQIAARGFDAESRGTDEFRKFILKERISRAGMVRISGAKVE